MSLSNEQKAIYALLADNVYWDVRKGYDGDFNNPDFTNSNWTPVPDGWRVIGKYDQSGSGSMRQTNPDLDGFTARVFKS